MSSNKKVRAFVALFKRAARGANVDWQLNESLQTPIETIIAKLLGNKLAIVGAVGFLAVFALCFIGSALLPLDESYTELTHANLRPSLQYLDFPAALEDERIAKVSSGISFSAAITEDGDFYIWGSEPNKEQQNVSTHIFDVPPEVYDANIVEIACGGNHVLAIDEHNQFYSWGYNGNGQTDVPQDIAHVFSSGAVSVIDADATSQWTAILGSDQNLYIWGSLQAKNTLLIPSDAKGHIVDFAAGDQTIALLLDDGTVRVIGDQGTEFAMNLPAHIRDGSTNIVDLVATNRNVLALDEFGALHTWGAAQDGLQTLPQIDDAVVSIAAGYRNFIALTDKGTLITWGNDQFGQRTMPDDLRDIAQVHADYYQFYAQGTDGAVYAWGNDGYLFGTDQFGRDIFTRLVHGGKTSLTVGAVAVFISVSIALMVGLTAGYFGGIVDHLLMRMTDVFSAIPFFPIAITLSYVVGFSLNQVQKLYMIMIILGLLGWMSLARLIRAQLLLEREKDFVRAARALGLKNRTIMWRHILPNIFSLVIVQITLGYAASLLSEAALSFLGFGVSEPTPSWGNMLSSAQEIAVIEFYWWRWLIPALFVVFTAVSVNLLGDALREALDPRSGE